MYDDDDDDDDEDDDDDYDSPAVRLMLVNVALPRLIVARATGEYTCGMVNGKVKTIHPLPPSGYYPCLRGRVSYNRKYRASQLSP